MAVKGTGCVDNSLMSRLVTLIDMTLPLRYEMFVVLSSAAMALSPLTKALGSAYWS